MRKQQCREGVLTLKVKEFKRVNELLTLRFRKKVDFRTSWF